MFNLREYQTRFCDRICDELTRHRSTRLTAFTASGKTVVMSELVRRFQPKRTMIIADRTELVAQAHDKILQHTGLRFEIDQADMVASRNSWSPGVVTTIQTMRSGRNGFKRYMRHKCGDYGLLLLDECDLAEAASWIEVAEHFKQNPDLKIVGVTATSRRHDKKDLSLFETVADQMGILEGINAGWLVNVWTHSYRVNGLDLSHLHTARNGDFVQSELQEIVEREQMVLGFCQPALEVMFGLPKHSLLTIQPTDWTAHIAALNRTARKTVMFCASVKQTELMAEVFNRVIPDMAAWVCGKTPSDERFELFKKFRRGDTRVLINCDVATRGYDDPTVEIIINAHPTKSRTRYIQRVGRGTRVLPNLVDHLPLDVQSQERLALIAASDKPAVRIVDFAGVAGKHKLVTIYEVLGEKLSDTTRERAERGSLDSDKPKSVLRCLTNAEAEIERKAQEERERRQRADAAKRQHIMAKSHYDAKEVDAFDYRRTRKSAQHMPREKNPVRRDNGVTDKLATLLERLKFVPNRMSKSQCMHLTTVLANSKWRWPSNREYPAWAIRSDYEPM